MPKLDATGIPKINATGEAPMSEAEKLACWINKVARELSNATARSVASHKLSAMEAIFLLRLDLGMDSPSAIASCMGIDASNLSRLIRRAEKQGYATREVDDDNRSRVILKLTPAGVTKAAAVRPDKRQMEEDIVSALTDTDVKNLFRILKKLSETLNSV